MAKSDNIFAYQDKSGEMSTVGIETNGRPAVLGETVIRTDDRLQMLKKQVRADDFADDDEYLQNLLDAAEEYVLVYTHRTKDELVEMGGGDMPRLIVHAMMLIAAHWYNQREAVSSGQMSEVPFTLSALVKPYIKLVNDRR